MRSVPDDGGVILENISRFIFGGDTYSSNGSSGFTDIGVALLCWLDKLRKEQFCINKSYFTTPFGSMINFPGHEMKYFKRKSNY